MFVVLETYTVAFLKAFTDDSASNVGDRRLFLAGYLHNTDVWEAFSREWARELRAWPPIEYFKAKEANRLSDQFDRTRGWNEAMRDARVRNFAEIIAHHKPFSYQFSINRRLVEDELKPISPYGLGRPHFPVCQATVAGIARFVAEKGITELIEFVFDNQEGVDDDMSLFFGELLRALPPDAQRLIEGVPSFRDDRSEGNLPLQAADLLAWHIRKEHETGTRLPLTRLLMNNDGHLVQDIPDDVVRMWAGHHKSQPGADRVRTKRQWREVKDESRRLIKAGIDPSKIRWPGTYYPDSAPLFLRLWGKLTQLCGKARMEWRAFVSGRHPEVKEKRNKR
jgi:hypothetical protein